jgi:hypothetical protein
MSEPTEGTPKWTVEEFLTNVYGWDSSCFIDNEDFLYGHSVRQMMEAWAEYKNDGRRAR